MSDRTSTAARFLGVWRQVWRHREFRIECLGTFGCLLVSVYLMSVFLRSVEMRHGVVLPDPVLSLYSASDLLFSGHTATMILLALYRFVVLTHRKLTVLSEDCLRRSRARKEQ